MFYVTSTQAENMNNRSTTFDSHFCSFNGEQFHEYTRLAPQEFIDLHERAGHRIEHLGTHKEKRFRESTGCDCPKVSDGMTLCFIMNAFLHCLRPGFSAT